MIYAYKKEDVNGDYVDANSLRWTVNTASRITGKKRDCWQLYESLEAALAHWGLVLYVDPEMEEELSTIE